jgi:V8-like Glu-specific endopeptidase
MKRPLSLALVVCPFLVVSGVNAQTNQAVADAKAAAVWVECGQRQGSGTVINGVDGYVLTAGHVVLDLDLATPAADDCLIAFSDSQGRPRFKFQTTFVRAVFNEKLNQDFAILKIGVAMGTNGPVSPFPFLKTNEFSSRGDAVYVLGYPGLQDEFVMTSGVITDYVDGYIDTTAEISPGNSGGTGIDALGQLIGVPTRIVTTYISSTSSQSNEVSYQLVDVRAVMNWLDTFGLNEHDRFFTHVDSARYHRSAGFITQQNLGCLDIARTAAVSSVYCIMGDSTRLAFPTDTVYFSWFPDFKQVATISAEQLARERLVRNVTFKPGTLVKLRTASQVYVVVDAFGTLRWIPSEQKAVDLWGPAWAGLVFDIEDEFWTSYNVGQPLEI